MKRILFCIQTPLTKTLGAPKVILELAEAMRELGWECDLRGRYDLDDAAGQSPISNTVYDQRLRRFLQQHAGEYDVVDYDHGHLPYPRTDFAPQTLFVARSVLLAHHFAVIPIPGSCRWKSRARRMILGGWERYAGQKNFRRVHRIMQEADLINVPNEDDKAELIRGGIAAEKIAVIPFGISRSRRLLFDAVSSAVPAKPVVAFVGTFDYRKGAREFPAIVQRIVAAVPEVRFRLLGTAGMFPTEAAVMAHFPSALQPKIEVFPRFKPEELPSLLAACSVGIFPSYIEGFGFGVLEMLAASVPVVAYDAPGPPMMLTPEYLVPRGEINAMSDKIAALLKDETKLRDSRVSAKRQSQQFSWEKSAKTTDETYIAHCKSERENSLSC